MGRASIIWVVLIVLYSCKVESSYSSVYSDFINQNQIDFIDFTPNESGELVLCYYYSKEKRILNYSVYNLTTEKEIYTNSAIAEKVDWYSNEEILIEGASRTEQDDKVIINVLTREVVNK